MVAIIPTVLVFAYIGIREKTFRVANMLPALLVPVAAELIRSLIQ